MAPLQPGEADDMAARRRPCRIRVRILQPARGALRAVAGRRPVPTRRAPGGPLGAWTAKAVRLEVVGDTASAPDLHRAAQGAAGQEDDALVQGLPPPLRPQASDASVAAPAGCRGGLRVPGIASSRSATSVGSLKKFCSASRCALGPVDHTRGRDG